MSSGECKFIDGNMTHEDGTQNQVIAGRKHKGEGGLAIREPTHAEPFGFCA
jgi:hypothetical protein